VVAFATLVGPIRAEQGERRNQKSWIPVNLGVHGRAKPGNFALRPPKTLKIASRFLPRVLRCCESPREPREIQDGKTCDCKSKRVS
jgi:hypothetical protein